MKKPVILTVKQLQDFLIESGTILSARMDGEGVEVSLWWGKSKPSIVKKAASLSLALADARASWEEMDKSEKLAAAAKAKKGSVG